MLQFIRHVLSFLLLSPLFQYISCCSLSETCGNESLYFVKFQYISCCSLSSFLLNRLSTLDSFNTSHVVVYQVSCLTDYPHWIVSIHLMLQFIFISICYFSLHDSFNTSHVVVYQSTACGITAPTVFQYISCCSLSIYSTV